MKELVAKEIAARVKDGESIGVGTGSTVDLALTEIGKRVKEEGLQIRVVPTSLQSAWKCQDIGLTVFYPGYRGTLSWGFDGADEVDSDFRLIKGKGGALLQEKILAAKCERFIVIVDESKVVSQLGKATAIPVEVIPEAYSIAESGLKKLGAEVTLRNCTGGKHGPIITEAGNLTFDAKFDSISDSLDREMKSIIGVVDTGLFVGLAHEVLVAGPNGVRKLERKR